MTISHLTVLSLVLPVSAFVVSLVLTAIVRRIALKVEFCARPSSERYHQRVVALGGGIAIFWTIALFILVGTAAVHWLVDGGKLPFLDNVTKVGSGVRGQRRQFYASEIYRHIEEKILCKRIYPA